jgi:hypothetical protein
MLRPRTKPTGELKQFRGWQMASYQEFDALQRALRDPSSEADDLEEMERGRVGRKYWWRAQVAAASTRQFLTEGRRQPTSSAALRSA